MKKIAFLSLISAFVILLAGCEYGTELPHETQKTTETETETETVIETVHEHSPVTDARVEPTCTETGLTEGAHCEICNEILTAQTEIPAKGHTYVTDARVEPTCTKKGLTEGAHCEICNEILTAQTEIPAKGHTYFTDARVEPTCTKTGLTEGAHCEICNEILTAQTEIPAKGHTYVTHARVEPTCTEKGLTEGAHCGTCNEILIVQTEIPATGHTAVTDARVEPTCTETGLTEGEHCRICNEILTAQQKILPGHSYGDDDLCTVCQAPKPTEGLEYSQSVNSDSYYVSGIGRATDTDIIIADIYNGLPVTNIAEHAFSDCSSLTSITIPNSVTSIGKGAFYGCTSLKSITLPFVGDSEGSLDNRHFGYIFGASVDYENREYVPSSLTSVIITDGNSIGGFEYCSSITSISIPDSVTSITRNAFYGCVSLTNITIPNSVASIGYQAFYNCVSLTSIAIPRSVTSIDDNAFSGCSKLIEVYNRSTLNIKKGNSNNGNVGYYALNVYTPSKGESKLHTVNNCIFYADGDTVYLVGYTGTDTVLTLPDNYSDKNYAIYNYAFYRCKTLTSINIYGGVTSIGNSAFYDCTNLTSITIPDSVTSIGEFAFHDCTSLTSVTLGENSQLTSIGSYTFYKCTSLESVTFGDSSQLTSIGAYAFYDCTSLESIIFGENSRLTSIKEYAFFGCSKLMSLIIPDKVTSIGDYAFSGCFRLVEIYNLSSLNIEKGSSSNGYVGYRALDIYTDANVQSKLHTVDNYVFHVDGDVVCLVGYTGTDTALTLPDSYDNKNYVINKHAFTLNEGLTSVTIADSVTGIGDFAFNECTNLESITFGENSQLSSIGEGAFQYCTHLISITFQGTTAEWNAISKGYNWNFHIDGNYTVTCTDGTVNSLGTVMPNA